MVKKSFKICNLINLSFGDGKTGTGGDERKASALAP